MIKQYSIAEARDRFASIIRELKRDEVVQVTRRGKLVAVMLPIDGYERLAAGRSSFWTNYVAFRDANDLESLAIEPVVFAGTRDPSPGRKVSW